MSRSSKSVQQMWFLGTSFTLTLPKVLHFGSPGPDSSLVKFGLLTGKFITPHLQSGALSASGLSSGLKGTGVTRYIC